MDTIPLLKVISRALVISYWPKCIVIVSLGPNIFEVVISNDKLIGYFILLFVDADTLCNKLDFEANAINDPVYIVEE